MRDGEALLVGATVGAGIWLAMAKRAEAARPGRSLLSTIASLPADAATALTAAALATQKLPPAAQTSTTAPVLGLDFGRPVPAHVRALVTSGWSKTRDSGARLHRALDIRLSVGSPILAIEAGEVIRVQKVDAGKAGLWVGVKHASGATSRYLHLSQTLVETGQRVHRGDALGLSGNTGNSQGPHLHLDIRVPRSMLSLVERAIGTPRGGWGPELAGYGFSIPGEPFVAVDDYEDDVKRDAKRAGIPLRRRNAGAAVLFLRSPELRNGALVYRPLGARGKRYPTWVRALKGKSGVYVIRLDSEVVYVGQSSAGKLYETLTRHVQEWRRYKGFWRGQYAEGHDPGLTYDRARVEVAARVLPADRALDEEARLIRRLKPRDNIIGQPEQDAVPF